MSNENLVVVSKLKAHIKSAHGLSTSGQVPAVLSAHIAQICAKAVENATKDRRKTIMDRDFAFLNEI